MRLCAALPQGHGCLPHRAAAAASGERRATGCVFRGTDRGRDVSPLLAVEDLVVHFRSRLGTIHAVDGVSLTIASGETLGLVGESGCGKSPLGKAIVGLVPPIAGTVRLEGETITSLSRHAMRPYRLRM